MPCDDGVPGLLTTPSGSKVNAACASTSADRSRTTATDHGPPSLEQSTGQRSTAQERVSTPFSRAASSCRAADPPLVVPPFVFSLGFGDGALMDPSGLQTAVEDAHQSHTQPNYSRNYRGEIPTSQSGRRGTFGGALNSEEQVDLCRLDFSGLDVADGPPTDRPDEQDELESSKQSGPLFNQWDFAYHTGRQGAFGDRPTCDKESASSSRSGFGGGQPTNQLGQGGMLDESLNSDDQVAWPSSLDSCRQVQTNEFGSKDSRNKATKRMQQPCLRQSSAVTTHLSYEQQAVRRHSVAHKAFAVAGIVDADCEGSDVVVHPPMSGTSVKDVQERDECSEAPRDADFSQQQQDFEAPNPPLILYESYQNNTAVEHSPSLLAPTLCTQAEARGAAQDSVASRTSVRGSGTEGAGMNKLELNTGEACRSRCIRNGCTSLAVESLEWDGEYCSRECVVSHCKAAFTAWVAGRLGAGGAAE